MQKHTVSLVFIFTLEVSREAFVQTEKLSFNIEIPAKSRDFLIYTMAVIPNQNGDSPRIAIQGYEGSFHQEAARNYFGPEVEVIPCASFRELVRIAENSSQSQGGIMAIENSIAGSILPNYNLLQKSQLVITGEIYLNIRQNLLVLPGVKMEDICEVHSHHMAIQQCLDFLEPYNWKLIETEDTALSALQLREFGRIKTAAIASALAADLFELEILKPDIHTMKNNYTRFLVLQPEAATGISEEANKASVNFYTDHSRGSLAKVLSRIADGGINLSKLQSFPIPGSQWLYAFHADLEFDSIDQYHRVLKEIEPLTAALRVYGVYKKGKTI